MRRKVGSAATSIIVLSGLLLLAVAPCGAQTGVAEESAPDPVLTGPGRGLGDIAAADTVRSNLWLVEALMAEIAAVGVEALPAEPATVRLEALTEAEANPLFRVVAANIIAENGHTVVLPPTDPEAAQPAADLVFRYDVHAVDLAFPETGRTLGIWKSWVARSIEVACTIEVVEEETGRLLMSERVVRGFHDRLDDDLFDDVQSDVYAFTAAEASESGWQRRTEELIVLGTLAGLIAVYFANTGN